MKKTTEDIYSHVMETIAHLNALAEKIDLNNPACDAAALLRTWSTKNDFKSGAAELERLIGWMNGEEN